MQAMTKPRLLLDCDGVLADFQTPWLDALGIIKHTVTTWGLSCTGKSPQEVRNARRTVESYVESLQPYPGVEKVILDLREAYDVHCVTALMVEGRRWWLEDWLGFDKGHIHMTQSKWLISGAIFVDDNPDLVEEWQEEHPYGLGYVMRRSYNEGWQGHLPRIEGLEELV